MRELEPGFRKWLATSYPKLYKGYSLGLYARTVDRLEECWKAARA